MHYLHANIKCAKQYLMYFYVSLNIEQLLCRIVALLNNPQTKCERGMKKVFLLYQNLFIQAIINSCQLITLIPDIQLIE